MFAFLRIPRGAVGVAVAVFGFLGTEARGAEPPVLTPVEPVLEHAEVDLKALRRGRVLTTAAWMAPAANHVGHLVMSPVLEEENSPALYGTGAFLGTSTVGMLVLPALVDGHAQRSRRRIQAQGGSVRQVSLPLITGLLSVVPVVIRGWPQQGEDAGPGQVAVAYGAYAAVLALPIRQMLLNHRARVRAGWVEAR